MAKIVFGMNQSLDGYVLVSKNNHRTGRFIAHHENRVLSQSPAPGHY